MRISAYTAVLITFVTVLAAATGTAAASGPKTTTTANLIANSGAEAGPGSPSNGVLNPPPRWTVTTGTSFTAMQYGASGGFPAATDPGPAHRGSNFFGGGEGDSSSVQIASQLPSLRNYLSAIGTGKVRFNVQGYFGGYASQGDNATLTVEWLNGTHTVGSTTIGGYGPIDRNDVTGLMIDRARGLVPANARQLRVTLTMTRLEGSYNDGYADNLSLKLTLPDAG